jgi:hypothetical protein
MRRLLTVIFAVAIAASACGKSSPTAPSNTGGAGVPSAGSAVITGSVQGPASALTAASGGAAITGVTVTVVGTSISTSVDVAGRFTLMNVPAGSVQLQLSGGGANATVSLGSVAAAQTLDVVVAVSGASASVESAVRSGSGEAELEGRVESLPPTMPALTFKAAGKAVKTDSATSFVDGSQSRAFADLRLGMRVHARGTLSGDTFTATRVEMQNSNTAIPVEVNGIVDSVTGTASAFQFRIGSRVIKGDAQTTFFGDGNTPDTFSSLRDGVRVEVKGEQRDDFVYATRIHVEDDDDADDDDGQDESASLHGVLNTMTGTAPNLVLTVGSTTVRTTSSTEVKRKGDLLPFSVLRTGMSLHVVGTRQTNGSIDARRLEIEGEDASEFRTEGTISGLTGTCPAVRFTLGGSTIVTSALTRFDNIGCSALTGTTSVEVRGFRQPDNTVAATRVSRK